MRFASAATLVAVLGGSLFAMRGATQSSGGDKPSPPKVTLGAAVISSFTKAARTYFSFAFAQARDESKEKIALDKMVAEVAKTSKAAKIVDPLVALEDWRDILQAAQVPEKPALVINSHELKEFSIPCQLVSNADVKEMKDAFDGKMKALVSVPADVAKVQYPVIIGLHPAEAETKSLANLRKQKEIGEAARQWAAATYSKDVLAKAIVIVPILDFVKRSDDAVSFTRPNWNSDDGKGYIFSVLDVFLRKALNYDVRRIFLDGAGSGAAAAVEFCALFPSVQSGAIVRGPVPNDDKFAEQFENAIGVPLLFVGGEKKDDKFVPYAKAILDKFGSADGYQVAQKESIDDAALLAWVNEHPKNYAPRKIRFRVSDPYFANRWWIRAFDVDSNLEKEPIVVDAAIDREKNEITVVTSKKVKSFEIFFNDDVLDLSRDVRVLHRKMEDTGEPKECFHGVVKRVLDYALESTSKGVATNTGEVYFNSKRIEIR